MAGRLIDARTSQHASFANSISTVLTVANSPQLVGDIGLQTAGVGAHPRVLLKGTVSVMLPTAPVATTITITIVRGLLPTDTLVYSASESLGVAILGPQVLTLSADDFSPPIPVSGQIAYSMFVASSAVGVIRVGPENFDGTYWTTI